MPTTAEECLDQIKRMILDLDPDEQRSLLDGLRDMTDSGDLDQYAATDQTDQPPYFEGRPERGGNPLERAADRRRMAQDARLSRAARAFDSAHDTGAADRARRDFARRFPNASRLV